MGMSLPGVNHLERGINCPPPSSAEVKDKRRATPIDTLCALWHVMTHTSMLCLLKETDKNKKIPALY
jgi:hypothetical protein